MDDKEGMFSKILRFLGLGCLYVFAVAFVLSSGCFIVVGVVSGSSEFIDWRVFVPIGLVFGVAAFLLIKFIIHINKKKSGK